MQKREGIITFTGNPLTLLGSEIKVGDKAPNFTALKNDLTPLSLDELKGKVVIISAVPSIDTPVCELQTVKFNQSAKELGEEVVILTISADLPFAQGRFCANKGIENSITLSDHKDLDFSKNYGFLIEELRLVSRGIVVINKEGSVTHVEYLKEITEHPNYELAIEKAKASL